MLSYQFTSSDDFKKLLAHTLRFTTPLLWRHIFVLYGGYSSVDANFMIRESTTNYRTSGYSAQASFRYDIPLSSKKGILHELQWGFDFKRTNNNLEFGGRPIEGKFVNLTQFMLGYNIGYRSNRVITTWEIESFFSPGRWIKDQSDKKFHSLRQYAKNRYVYFRSSFSFILKLFKDFTLHNYFRGQYSTTNLLPSEMFGLGGYDTVRGYKERIVNTDNAFVLNTELHTSQVSLWKMVNYKGSDSFKFLGFFDLGWGSKHKKAEGEKKHRLLLSIGPGLRYSIVPYITFRADWGFRLNGLSSVGFHNPHNKFHFSIVAGY